MRQLDLFGSFTEVSPPQNEAMEKPVDLKKEEEKLILTYKENVLPQLFSLFDHSFSEKNSKDLIANNEAVSTNKQIDSSLLVDRQDIKHTVELPPTAIAEEKGILDVADEQSITTPFAKLVEVIKRKTDFPKEKNQKIPELERTGSVIFDDGKITVKIKNKSPFPDPIVKVKKEKIKKPLQKRGRKSLKEIDAEVDLIEIPDDEILFQKQYYPISEVAKWFRVNNSLLRFWENEFDVLQPKKNRKGDRLFRPEDVKNLQLIYQLLRQRKYTVEGAKEYIKTNKKKTDIQLQLTNTLQKFRNFLLDLKANLQ